jgi:glycosyltransferase involved in cell wall biosynthesis
MPVQKQFPSLSIFFPFFNDAGTVEQAIKEAYFYGQKVTSELEVIALHGGNSTDNTFEQILAQQKKYPHLKIIDRRQNTEGYAVIKHGLKSASKDWIFYTDGDIQYFVEDLLLLVTKQKETQADVVNGYKQTRNDHLGRVLGGKIYQGIAKKLFHLPIRDVDCDFRLIRRKLLDHTSLESRDSSILPELIIKLKKAGASFAEVPVRHRARVYGKSNYRFFSLVKEKVIGDLRLFLQVMKQS